MLSILAAEKSQPAINDSTRKTMRIRRYLGAALVAASAATVLIDAPPAVADPVTPYPCDKQWQPPRARGICDKDPTAGAAPPAPPVAPRGPLPSGPGGLR
jgi:hypothetical protein